MTTKARRRRQVVRFIENAIYLVLLTLGVLLTFAVPELICKLIGVGL